MRTAPTAVPAPMSAELGAASEEVEVHPQPTLHPAPTTTTTTTHGATVGSASPSDPRRDDPPTPFQIAAPTDSGSAFGERAGALAAALDRVGSSGSVAAAPDADAYAEASAAPAAVSQARWCRALPSENDHVEISATALRRFAASDQECIDLLGEEDDDTDEAEGDSDDDDERLRAAEGAGGAGAGGDAGGATGGGGGAGDTLCRSSGTGKRKGVGAKRRKREGGPRADRDRPPGAPAVGPASSVVDAAVRAAAADAEAVVPTAEVSCSGGGSGEATTVSFGPRFQGMSAPELEAAQKQWTLHSLADVQPTTSDDNRLAAANLFAELRGRRRLGATAVAAVEGNTAATQAVAEGVPRPTFRRPAPRHDQRETLPAPALCEQRDGVRIMEECVAGGGARRKRKVEVPMVADNSGPISSGERTVARRSARPVCAAAEEDMDDY